MQDPYTYDVAIIGAGMAGLTAAIYAARANKSVIVLEGKTHGGQIITSNKIANYPGIPSVSGVDLMNNVYEQAKKLGAVIEYEEVLGAELDGKIKAIRTEDDSDIKSFDSDVYAASVIIAVGAHERKLGLENEEALTGHGISYCATCDGGFYKNKPVAVVGGGNSALYEAIYLSDIASKVYIVQHRSVFHGDAILVDKLREKENVEFVMDSTPIAYKGEKKVEGLVVENSKHEKRELEVDGIFVAIGRVPATEIFENQVELENGYIKAGEDCHTSISGVFVAGDCRTKSVRQLITAASDGAVAATEAVQYLG